MPVCQSVATTHQVGEGQLIATGEPPKNSRNIGLMYYRCPECGNSPNSKKITEYIHAHSVSNLTELQPKAIEQTSVVDTVLITAPPLIETIKSTELTESVKNKEASHDAVTNRQVTETQEDNPESAFPFKRAFIALAALLFLFWALRQLMPKPEKQGGEHVTA